MAALYGLLLSYPRTLSAQGIRGVGKLQFLPAGLDEASGNLVAGALALGIWQLALGPGGLETDRIVGAGSFAGKLGCPGPSSDLLLGQVLNAQRAPGRAISLQQARGWAAQPTNSPQTSCHSNPAPAGEEPAFPPPRKPTMRKAPPPTGQMPSAKCQVRNPPG
jgi:hypothetical protein